MESVHIASVLSGVFTLVGAALGAWVAHRIHLRQSVDLEKDQVRRMRVELVNRLLGMRYILGEAVHPSQDERRRFNESLNLAALYFADDEEAKHAFARFRSLHEVSALLDLLRVLAKKIGLNLTVDEIHNLHVVRDRGSLGVQAPLGGQN